MKKTYYIILMLLLPLCSSADMSEDSLFTAVRASISQEEIDSMVANPPPQDATSGWIDFYKEARKKNAPQHLSYGKIMVAFYRRLQVMPAKKLWCIPSDSSATDEVAEALSMQLEAIATEWADEKIITIHRH